MPLHRTRINTTDPVNRKVPFLAAVLGRPHDSTRESAWAG